MVVDLMVDELMVVELCVHLIIFIAVYLCEILTRKVDEGAIDLQHLKLNVSAESSVCHILNEFLILNSAGALRFNKQSPDSASETSGNR